MPQAKQTEDEMLKVLIRRLSAKDPTPKDKRGDQLELDEDDERALNAAWSGESAKLEKNLQRK